MKAGGADLATLEKLANHFGKLIYFCTELKKEVSNLSNFFENIDVSILDIFSSVPTFSLLTKVDSLPKDWNKKTIDELEVIVKEVIICGTAIDKKNKFYEEFSLITSRAPEEVY